MIQIPLYAVHLRPTSEKPFKWRFAGVLVIAMKPYIIVIFLRGPPIPPPPPGSAHDGSASSLESLIYLIT